MRLRLLDLHLQRVADTAHAEREAGLEAGRAASPAAPAFAGRVEFRGVSFRHSEAEPEVLSDLDLAVAPGEFVAITGPSGGSNGTLHTVQSRPDRRGRRKQADPSCGHLKVDGPLATQ